MQVSGVAALWLRTSVLRLGPTATSVRAMSSFYRDFPGIRTAGTSKKHMQKMQSIVDRIVGIEREKKPKVVPNPPRAKTVQAQNERRPIHILLPKWFVKVVRPGNALRANEVQLHVPMKMTKFDVKNYMESIYNLKVAQVRTRIQLGKLRSRSWTKSKLKSPDFKVAYVVLSEGTFTYPTVLELFPDIEDRKPRRPSFEPGRPSWMTPWDWDLTSKEERRALTRKKR